MGYDSRGDQSAYSNRLLKGPDSVSGHGGGYGIAVDSRRLLTKPLQEIGRVRSFSLGVCERLSILPGN